MGGTISKVDFFRLLALRGALSLELKGLKRSARGRTTYSIIKREFGLRGSRQSVYTQFCELIEKQRAYVSD